jgi:hypothetical protein
MFGCALTHWLENLSSLCITSTAERIPLGQRCTLFQPSGKLLAIESVPQRPGGILPAAVVGVFWLIDAQTQVGLGGLLGVGLPFFGEYRAWVLALQSLGVV